MSPPPSFPLILQTGVTLADEIELASTYHSLADIWLSSASLYIFSSHPLPKYLLSFVSWELKDDHCSIVLKILSSAF